MRTRESIIPPAALPKLREEAARLELLPVHVRCAPRRRVRARTTGSGTSRLLIVSVRGPQGRRSRRYLLREVVRVAVMLLFVLGMIALTALDRPPM